MGRRQGTICAKDEPCTFIGFASKNEHSSRSCGSIWLRTSKTATTCYGEYACNSEGSRKKCFGQNNMGSRSGVEVEFLDFAKNHGFLGVIQAASGQFRQLQERSEAATEHIKQLRGLERWRGTPARRGNSDFETFLGPKKCNFRGHFHEFRQFGT